MRTTILVLLLLTSFAFAFSHPGVGIVMDRRGNVYYTDLKQVWKIFPDGHKAIVVRNVHTHELYVDSLGNLYGEHLRYEGEATNRWWHRVWKLSPGGQVTDLIPERQGFLDDFHDFHFVHDAHNNFYWAARGDTTFIRRRSPDGTITTIAAAKFQDVRWMTVASDGTVYFADLYDLVRVSPDGAVKTIARGLASWTVNRLTGPDRHAIMGLWTDTHGNVYAAIAANSVVRRVAPDGKVKTVDRSRTPWSPSGGFVAPNGDLWVLEYTITNAVRVRCVRTDGKMKVYD
jgi:hypothetical protein